MPYLESLKILCLLRDQLFPEVINHRPRLKLFKTSLNKDFILNNNNISHLINRGSTHVSSIPARDIASASEQTEADVGNNSNVIPFFL